MASKKKAKRKKKARKKIVRLPHPDGYRFDKEAAKAAVYFFEHYLHHIEGEFAGQPFILQPWQRDIVSDIYGWKRPDGTRQYRTVYIEVPRKNGKSTLGAGFALYGLHADHEPGAQVYSVAGDRQQAGIVFNIAKQMTLRNEHLKSATKMYVKAMTVESTGSRYWVLSKESKAAHGYNPSMTVFDELHVQPNRDLWDAMVTGMGSRRQPLLITITTAGWDKHSICYEQHEYARRILDGIHTDPSYYPVIFAAEADANWTKRRTWAKANPNLGVSLKLEYFIDQATAAMESPSRENSFRRLHLNQWTEQDIRWLNMDKWDACAEGEIAIEDLKGKLCFAGLDMASTRDVTAFVMVFPIDGKVYVLPEFWIPSEGAHRRERVDRVPYVTWAKQGLMHRTPGDVLDFAHVRKRINELGKIYNIKEIGVDRWETTQLQAELTGDGFEMVPFGQGYGSMSAPTKKCEVMMLERTLCHFGNPVLRWMAANVTVQEDETARLKPNKKKSTEKIDGIVALIMALGRMIADEGEKKSKYEDAELVTV